MKIGLIDVDGKNFPNLALMKISAFHKKQGNQVEWVNYFEEYDKVYMSKIFSFSKEILTVIQAKEIIKGGSGYDMNKRLPQEIESMRDLDYTIYPMYKFSLQYFSRGCIRNCPFCLVRKKEGYIHSEIPYNLNPNGKHIEILDNNFFANPNWKDAAEYIIKSKQRVNLHGVDIRIMNQEQAHYLNRFKMKKSNIHIAWDNPKDNILPQLKEMVKYVKRYKITCYVLIGYWSTMEEDYSRVKILQELGIEPFVQPYRDFENKRIPTQYEKDFASWVNKKERFKSFDFKDFKPRKNFVCQSYLTNLN